MKRGGKTGVKEDSIDNVELVLLDTWTSSGEANRTQNWNTTKKGRMVIMANMSLRVSTINGFMFK